MHDQAKLVADLSALGLQPGDAVMVHSSYTLHSTILLTTDFVVKSRAF
jgi:aminoglycoside N3'-acetyltransferase|eukprot:COSAG02_NODE_1068_length_14812_cov_15.091342_4_plen_48_part_00